MSAIGGPNIIEDGLMLALDAANQKSYTGTGTAWKDLSGNGNNGTLVNSPTFDSDNLGSLVFDGINESVDNIGTNSSFNFIHSTRIFSIEMWVKFTNLNKRQFFFGNVATGTERGIFMGLEYLPNSSFNFGVNSLRLQTVAGISGNRIGNLNTTQDNAISDLNWHHIAYTSDASDNFGKWYVDASLQSRKQSDGFFRSLGNTSTNNANRTMCVGRINHSSLILPMDGQVSKVKVYNKALTFEEVLQNYNATKGRFNL